MATLSYKVKLNAIGSTNINVSAQAEGSLASSVVVPVTVTEQPTTQLEVSPQSLEGYVGQELTLEITTDATSATVTSENPDIASVEAQ